MTMSPPLHVRKNVRFFTQYGNDGQIRCNIEIQQYEYFIKLMLNTAPVVRSGSVNATRVHDAYLPGVFDVHRNT